MDVPGDGNCGYHAVMALLREKGVIDSNLSITMMRRDVYMFIKDNTEDVFQTLDYCVTFRDRVDRDIRIQSFSKHGDGAYICERYKL